MVSQLSHFCLKLCHPGFPTAKTPRDICPRGEWCLLFTRFIAETQLTVMPGVGEGKEN